METFKVTVTELEAEKLLHTLGHRLAEMQVQTTDEQRGYSKWRSKQFADKGEEVRVETLSDRVAELEAKRLLDTLCERLAEMRVETTR